MTVSRIVVLVVILGAIGAVLAMNLGPKEVIKVGVQLEKATVEPITQRVTASGKIRPETQVKISADVGGYIRKLTVIQGDMVKAGQLLVQVDPEVYKARVMQAEAAEATAKANVTLSQANLERARGEVNRVKGLYAKDLTSSAALEKAQSDFAVAQAQVEGAGGQLLQAQATLASAQKDLSKCSIVSPMDGKVIELLKKLGERVAGGEFREDIVMTVADLSRMEVEVEVGERDVVLIHEKDPVEIEVDAYPGQKIPGTVKEIGAAGVTRNQWTEAEVTNFRVVVTVGETEKVIRPQMSATVGIRTAAKEQALTVPIQAVTVRRPSELVEPPPDQEGRPETPGGPGEPGPPPAEGAAAAAGGKAKEEAVEVVFMIDGGKAKAVPVKTGLTSDTRIEILEGLKEGDEIISGPYRALSKELKPGVEVSQETPGTGGQGKRRGPPGKS